MSESESIAPSKLARDDASAAIQNELECLHKGLTELAQTFLFAPMRTRIDETLPGNPRWCPTIRRMLAAGYPFNSVGFEAEGCLLRAWSAGFKQLINGEAQDRILHSQSGKHSALFESVFDVQFLTHEISDAVTARGQPESSGDNDNAIVVIDARRFNQANKRGLAASLSVGDSGQVFHYPFLAEPIRMDDIVLAFVDQTRLTELKRANLIFKDRLIGLPGDDRTEHEARIEVELAQRGLRLAEITNDAMKPVINEPR